MQKALDTFYPAIAATGLKAKAGDQVYLNPKPLNPKPETRNP
jgi:hypothetical protein